MVEILSGGTKSAPPALSVRRLAVTFPGPVIAVDGVDLEVAAGRMTCLVGESGSGKTVTAQAIMRLLRTPPAAITAEHLNLDGVDLLSLSPTAMESVRGNRIAMIFQEPMTSLNPVLTIGRQIAEVYVRHRAMSWSDAEQAAVRMMTRVAVPNAAERAQSFPHQMSGGMRQRAMIAMALACDPRLLIADEPTTALDVTIQAEILGLLARLQRDFGTSILFITHNLAVVAEIADWVYVMYAGRIVESGSREAIFSGPQHPYTIGLLAAMPRDDGKAGRLAAIPGNVPSPASRPSGCAFHARCPFADRRCRSEAPALRDMGDRHVVACWRAPIEDLAS